MRWGTNMWDKVGDALRFFAGAGILISGIFLSLWVIWLVARLLLHLRGFLDRVLFSSPW